MLALLRVEGYFSLYNFGHLKRILIDVTKRATDEQVIMVGSMDVAVPRTVLVTALGLRPIFNVYLLTLVTPNHRVFHDENVYFSNKRLHFVDHTCRIANEIY